MRVLVTGGTGFVGSHTVAALVAQGHDVRLLVRHPDRIHPALDPLGVKDIEHVVGDVTSAFHVARALRGCDAVVHAAAVFSLDSRSRASIGTTNVAGASVVLKAAIEQGCDPIVHISSTVALMRPNATVDATSPLSTDSSTYIRSKVESERVARELQAKGAPIVIVQPGAVFGPNDPHLSDNMRRLRDILRGLYPMWPTGGYHVVDVRDVAAVNAAIVSQRQKGSFVVPGSYVDGHAFFDILRKVTGRRLPHLTVPATAMLPITWAVSQAQKVLPFHLPADHEGIVILRYRTRCDDSLTRSVLKVEPRPFEETLGDSVRWLKQAGLIKA